MRGDEARARDTGGHDARPRGARRHDGAGAGQGRVLGGSLACAATGAGYGADFAGFLGAGAGDDAGVDAGDETDLFSVESEAIDKTSKKYVVHKHRQDYTLSAIFHAFLGQAEFYGIIVIPENLQGPARAAVRPCLWP